MKGYDGNKVLTSENSGLSLATTNGTPVVRMNAQGKIEKYPGVELVLDETVSSNLLGFRIESNGALLGYLGIKFSSDAVYVTPSE